MPSRPRYSGNPLLAHGYSLHLTNWANAAKPIYIAHRGNMNSAPENTLAAFRHAIAMGCPAIEVDVQPNDERLPIVMHDPTVDRTTDGTGDVDEMTLEDLAMLDAGSWFSTNYSEKVPTLYDVLNLSDETLILLHIKDNYLSTSLTSLIALLQKLNLRKRLIIASEVSVQLQAVHAADPGFTLLRYSDTQVTAEDLATDGCTWVGVKSAAIDAAYVTAMHAAGVTVIATDVYDLTTKTVVAGYGVDGYMVADYSYIKGLISAAYVTLPYTADWSRDFLGTGWTPPIFNRTLTTCGSDVIGRTVKDDGESVPYANLIDGIHKVPQGNVKIAFTVTLKQAAADVSRWAGLRIQQNDKSTETNTPVPAGYNFYNFFIRQSGAMALNKHVAGSNYEVLGTVEESLTAMQVDVGIPIEISFNGNDITFERTDTSDTITVTDATWRGGLMNFCMRDLAAQFSSLTITALP
jgi:glycerophosphoryl diester phosphodiesterase